MSKIEIYRKAVMGPIASKKEERTWTKADLEAERPTRDNCWAKMLSKHSEHMMPLDKILHFSGGGLILLFGDAATQNQIWSGLVEAAAKNRGNVEIFGVSFSLSELSMLGDFARFAYGLGYKFHCIDERLDEDGQHDDCLIHESCGAIGAVQEAIFVATGGKTDVEAEAMETFQQPVEQHFASEMSATRHETATIYVTYGTNGQCIQPKLRTQIREQNALPMNVTIPIELMAKFVKARNGVVSLKSLQELVVKWNIGIARKVIGDEHNSLSEMAKEVGVLLVSDVSGTGDNAHSALEINSTLVRQQGDRNLMKFD
jgi:hypothetical protein